MRIQSLSTLRSLSVHAINVAENESKIENELDADMRARTLDTVNDLGYDLLAH